jgi:hypothetical protein
MLDASGGDFLETLGDGAIKGSSDTDVEATPDKGQPEGFTSLLSQLDADAAENAFARFKENLTVLEVLFERTALIAKAIRVCPINLGVFLEFAVTDSPAIAMETAAGFERRLVAAKAGASAARRCLSRRLAGIGEEELDFGLVQAAHHAGEGLFAGMRCCAREEGVDGLGGGLSFAQGANELFEDSDGAAGGEDVGHAGLVSLGVDFEPDGSGGDAETLGVGLG